MQSQPPIRVIAVIVALSAFAVACIAGLGAGLEGTVILTRALVSMAGGYVLGGALGWAAGRAVREHTARHARANPVPPVALAPDEDAEEERGVAPEDAQEPRSPQDPTPESGEGAQPRAAA